MLYRFKSQASADVVMLETNARQLLDIIGKTSGTSGVITVDQMPGAISALEAAVALEARSAKHNHDAHAAEEEHLHEPVEQDRDLAEEEGAVEIRRQQDVVEHQQRDGEHAGGAEDVVEVGQRGEAPLVPVQADNEVDQRRVNQKERQQQFQPFDL